MSSPRVAIVDIGSNSIKVLVAERSPHGPITPLLTKTLDARIGSGISKAKPRLAPDSIERGLAAIRELLDSAAPFSPARTVLVATSAVRDAENGTEFRDQVRAITGHDIRILSGQEEANLIGRGLTCDITLNGISNFYVFDLGGGSLECLSFCNGKIQQALSLQLGCVRLTEKFISDSTQPLSGSALAAVSQHTTSELTRAKFSFNLPYDAVAVGTGGTVTTVRAIIAAGNAQSLEETDTRIPIQSLRALLTELSSLSLSERKKVGGLPPGRADVFPTALATLIAIAETGGFDAYQHSVYNLRYGLAAEALEAV
jgi:exopolyphosphatase/guanosine-5'-triphosphate,3'-diphosphate pyrophosphatase